MCGSHTDVVVAIRPKRFSKRRLISAGIEAHALGWICVALASLSSFACGASISTSASSDDPSRRRATGERAATASIVWGRDLIAEGDDVGYAATMDIDSEDHLHLFYRVSNYNSDGFASAHQLSAGWKIDPERRVFDMPLTLTSRMDANDIWHVAFSTLRDWALDVLTYERGAWSERRLRLPYLPTATAFVPRSAAQFDLLVVGRTGEPKAAQFGHWITSAQNQASALTPMRGDFGMARNEAVLSSADGVTHALTSNFSSEHPLLYVRSVASDWSVTTVAAHVELSALQLAANGDAHIVLEQVLANERKLVYAVAHDGEFAFEEIRRLTHPVSQIRFVLDRLGQPHIGILTKRENDHGCVGLDQDVACSTCNAINYCDAVSLNYIRRQNGQWQVEHILDTYGFTPISLAVTSHGEPRLLYSESVGGGMGGYRRLFVASGNVASAHDSQLN